MNLFSGIIGTDNLILRYILLGFTIVISIIIGRINIVGKVLDINGLSYCSDYDDGIHFIKDKIENKTYLIVSLLTITKAVFSTIILGLLITGISGLYLCGIALILSDIFPKGKKKIKSNGLLIASTVVFCTNPIVFIALLVLYFIVLLCSKYHTMGMFVSFLVYPLILQRILSIFENLLQTSLLSNTSTLFAIVITAIVLIRNKNILKDIREGNAKKVHFNHKK